MNENEYGVHITHCCSKHGCKYNNEDCPVVLGIVNQDQICEDCYYDIGDDYEPKENMFIEAFKKGQENYKKMLEDIGEIQYVLNILEEQLNTISKNKLKLYVGGNDRLYINKEEICYFNKTDGFPIKVTLNNKILAIEDKQDLEDFIVNMLKDVEINSRIVKLMNYE